MFEERIGYSYLKTRFWLVVAFLGGVFLSTLINQIFPGERIILVPPTLKKDIKVTGNKVSPDYLEEMALFFVPYIANVHPHTVDSSVDFILNYVGTENYGNLKSTLKSEADRIRKQEISQTFFPKRTLVEGDTVIVEGLLKRYIGTVKTSEVPYRYEISFEKNTVGNLRLINNISHSVIK